LPSLSSHGGPHDGPPHSVTPRTPSGSSWAKPKYGWGGDRELALAGAIRTQSAKNAAL
jgi:hypothetical protein